MKRKIILTILSGILSIALITGCSQSSSDRQQSVEGYTMSKSANYDYGYNAGGAIDYEPETWETGAENGTGSSGSGSGTINNTDEFTVDPTQSRLLIRTVNMSVETKELDKVKTDLEIIVGADGGYIESSNLSGTGKDKNLRTLTYTIRVPADQLDAIIAAVGNSCTVLSSNENSVDVTLEYVDTKSRVESLRVEYNQLMELLRNADDLDQIITLQNRLTEVRYQIESYESRLRVLENQVTYATLNLTIREVLEETVIEPAHEPTYSERVSKQFKEMLENTKIFFEDLGLIIIACLPGIIFLGINAIIIVAIIKSVRKKKRKVRKPNVIVPPMSPKPDDMVKLAGDVAMPTDVTPVKNYQKPKYAEEIQAASTHEENKKEYAKVGLSGKVVLPEDRQTKDEIKEATITDDLFENEKPVARQGLVAIHDIDDKSKEIPEEEPLDENILIKTDDKPLVLSGVLPVMTPEEQEANEKYAEERRRKFNSTKAPKNTDKEVKPAKLTKEVEPVTDNVRSENIESNIDDLDKVEEETKAEIAEIDKKLEDEKPLKVANCDKEYMKEKHDFNEAASKLMNEDRANEDE